MAAVTAKITAQAGMRTVVAMKWRPTIVRATPNRPRAMATNEKKHMDRSVVAAKKLVLDQIGRCFECADESTSTNLRHSHSCVHSSG